LRKNSAKKLYDSQIFNTPYSIQDYFSLSETSSLSLPQNLSTPDTFSIGEKSLSIGLSLRWFYLADFYFFNF